MGFSGGQRQGTQYGTRHRGVGVFDIGRDISANMERTDYSYFENNQQAIEDVHRKHYSGGRKDSGTSRRRQYGTEGQAYIAGCQEQEIQYIGQGLAAAVEIRLAPDFESQGYATGSRGSDKTPSSFQKELSEYKGQRRLL